MDVAPIIDAVKGMSEMQKAGRNKAGLLYMGSIDPYTAQNWAKECGHPVGDKAWTAYAMKKLQSSDYAHFRAEASKRYV